MHPGFAFFAEDNSAFPPCWTSFRLQPTPVSGSEARCKKVPEECRSYCRHLHLSDTWFVRGLLEHQFQRHLQNPRIAGRADLTEIAVLKSEIGIPKIHIVKGVVELRSKLVRDPFPYLSVFEQR
jgi:hypothetical protein